MCSASKPDIFTVMIKVVHVLFTKGHDIRNDYLRGRAKIRNVHNPCAYQDATRTRGPPALWVPMRRGAAADAEEGSSECSDSDSAPPEEAISTHAPPKAGRANKNRPSELSSRKKVSTFRLAPGLSSSTPKSRDPRFDHGAKVDEEAWRRSYEFLYDMQREEADGMKRKLAESAAAAPRAKQRGGGEKRRRTRAKVLGPEEEEALRKELERTSNRLAQEERRQKRERVEAQMRREEVAAVKEGKKPFFPKKSAVRERELLSQYEELKRQGKLEKFLEKRRRKVAAKMHTKLPRAGLDS